MEERIREIEERIAKVKAEGEKEIAELRRSVTSFPMLDADLAAWKKKLLEKASMHWVPNMEWALHAYTTRVESEKTTFTLKFDQEWSAETWVRSGGIGQTDYEIVTVAYATEREHLMPPPMEAMRLELYGLTWVVAPLPDVTVPSKKINFGHHSEIRVFTYGLHKYLDPRQLPPPGVTNPEELAKIYKSSRDESAEAATILVAQQKIAKLEQESLKLSYRYSKSLKDLENWKKALESRQNMIN